MSYAKELEGCKDFGDVFNIVKKSVKEVLGLSRPGLILYLADLPMNVGAFHAVGSNGIVMNRRLLNTVLKSAGSRLGVNSFVYSILLHEYLHSLGCLDEGKVRQLVYEVSKKSFGESHLATQMALRGPFEHIPRVPSLGKEEFDSEIQISKDFDKSNKSYIS